MSDRPERPDAEARRQLRHKQEDDIRRRNADFELRRELAEAWEKWKSIVPSDFSPEYVPRFTPVPDAYWPALAKGIVHWMGEFKTRGLLGRLDHLDRFPNSLECQEAIDLFRVAAKGKAKPVEKKIREIFFDWDFDFWKPFELELRAAVPERLIDPPPLPEPDPQPAVPANDRNDEPTPADIGHGLKIYREMGTRNPSKERFRVAFRSDGSRGSNKKLNRVLDIVKAIPLDSRRPGRPAGDG